HNHGSRSITRGHPGCCFAGAQAEKNVVRWLLAIVFGQYKQVFCRVYLLQIIKTIRPRINPVLSGQSRNSSPRYTSFTCWFARMASALPEAMMWPPETI